MDVRLPNIIAAFMLSLLQNCAFICLYSILSIGRMRRLCETWRIPAYSYLAAKNIIHSTVNKWLLDYCFLWINEESASHRIQAKIGRGCKSVGSAIFGFFRVEKSDLWVKHVRVGFNTKFYFMVEVENLIRYISIRSIDIHRHYFIVMRTNVSNGQSAVCGQFRVTTMKCNAAV